MPDAPKDLPEEQIHGVTRHENFESWYSNNVQFHPTEYDLKLIFGDIDWLPPAQGVQAVPVVQQHTAISLSWLQAKLMLYFLTVHIGVYELVHGWIPIPSNVAPSEPQPPSGEAADNPNAQRVYELIREMRKTFIEGPPPSP